MDPILIIEDDPDIALSLKYALEREGYSITVSENGEEGLARALGNPPGLILLDLNLPGVDGSEVCRRLRNEQRTQAVPIIMVTARVSESQKISGLDLGADDYIAKPFSIKEVLARVRAVLRRVHPAEETEATLRAGLVELDPGRRKVTVRDSEIRLTRKEFDLLAELLKSRGRVLGRQLLLERVWGYDHPGTTRTVDVHVRQLRRKLGSAAAKIIETVVGVGYRISQREQECRTDSADD